MHRVRMLIHFGVTPYLVFDGDNLPSKAGTENDRAKRREESKKRGMELHRAGKIAKAYPEFQKAVDVTPKMARQLIDELKKAKVQYVVAPFEADAQLAHLERKGVLDGVLSEDSDMLVYGVKVLITKLDQHGECILIRRSDFASNRDMALAGFTDANFRHMAILSGCDYLNNIPKFGLKTAHSYVRKYKTVEKILRILQFEQKFMVPVDYLNKFYEAERTFLHHRVFCPIERRMILSGPLENGLKEEDMPYLGAYVEIETAIGVACGDLDPMTKSPIMYHIAGLSRSMPNLHRRQAANIHTLKPSKSIDTFFKPKRQPLAELDPNSLAPSPSQQRLLHQHRNSSWEAQPVSAPPVSAPPARRPVVQPIRSELGPFTERSTFLERAGTLSTFQPVKRTRLCSDVNISPGSDQHSRFFATPDKSPSLPRGGRTKKARRSDIEIFSDDSVADVLQDLIQQENSSTGNIVAEPVEPRGTPDPPIVDESSAVQVCRTPSDRKGKSKEYAEKGPFEFDDGAEGFVDLEEVHESRLNLAKTFSYQSQETQTNAFSLLRAGASKLRTENKVTRPTKLPAPSLPRGQSDRSGSAERTFGMLPASQQRRALSSLGAFPSPNALSSAGAPQSSTEKVKLGREALAFEQRCPPEQLSRSDPHNQSVATPTNQGHAIHDPAPAGLEASEDVIIPNSEDEGTDLSESEVVRPKYPPINFARFAFTGRP